MKTRLLALFALVLGMASCQTEFTAENEARGEVAVELSVSAPELIGATRTDGDANRALNSAFGAIDYLDGNATGDRWNWSKVDLRYSLEVYDVDDLDEPIKDRMVIIVDDYQPVKFDLRLIPNRNYQFVIFADFVGEGAADVAVDYNNQANLGLRHTIGANLTDITIKGEAINDEVADAYFKTFTYMPESNTSNVATDNGENIVLQRPYAKVRVVATDLADLNLNVEPMSVKVEYSDVLVPTTFNAVTGAIGTQNSSKVYTFNYVDQIRTNRADHVYNAGYDAEEDTFNTVYGPATRATHLTLFTDYILAGEQQHAVSFKMTTYDAKDCGGKPIKTVDFNTDIPVKRNHLTTIIGNLFTGETVVKITIDDNFANADNIEDDPFYVEVEL